MWLFRWPDVTVKTDPVSSVRKPDTTEPHQTRAERPVSKTGCLLPSVAIDLGGWLCKPKIEGNNLSEFLAPINSFSSEFGGYYPYHYQIRDRTSGIRLSDYLLCLLVLKIAQYFLSLFVFKFTSKGSNVKKSRVVFVWQGSFHS